MHQDEGSRGNGWPRGVRWLAVGATGWVGAGCGGPARAGAERGLEVSPSTAEHARASGTSARIAAAERAPAPASPSARAPADAPVVLECTFDYPPEAAHRELAGTRVMFGYGPGGRLGAIALPPGEGSVTLFPDGDGPRPSATWETLELRAAEGELRYLAFRYRVVGTRLEVEGETAVGACVLGAPP